MEKQDRPKFGKTNKAIAHAEGAATAFTLSLLHEFSVDGGTGVVEIRFVEGKPIEVFVRALKDGEHKPQNTRGIIAGWELTSEDLAKVFLNAA